VTDVIGTVLITHAENTRSMALNT